MKTTKLSIVTVAFILCSNILFSQDNKFTKTYDLNYSLEKSTRFTLSNTSYFVQHKKIGEEINKFQQSNFKMALNYSVIDSNDKGLQFQVEYQSRMRENYYKKEIQGMDYSKLLGGKIKYKLSNKGIVSDFEDFESLDTELPDGGNESIDQLKEEIIHMLPTLPDNPVSVGDKWNAFFGGDEGYESFSVEYTLLDELIKDGIECVKIIASYTTSESYEVTLGGKKYQLESKSAGHDIYYFAYKKGFLLSRYSVGNGTTDVYDLNKVLSQQRLGNVLYETRIIF